MSCNVRKVIGSKICRKGAGVTYINSKPTVGSKVMAAAEC